MPDAPPAAGSLRRELNGELHARPFVPIEGGQRVLHLALPDRSGGDAGDPVRRLADLCAGFGPAPPDPAANHHLALLGDVRLKWERHTEFTTYTFFRDGRGAAPFDDVFAAVLPAEWLEAARRDALVATRVAVERLEGSAREAFDLGTLFVGSPLVGARVLGGGAEAWTDFRIHGDGCSRVLVADLGLREQQGGRLVQRLLEIETYLMMAMLALPAARQANRELGPLEQELVRITATLSGSADEGGDQDLLKALSGIAGRLEWLAASHAYRFSAARAYDALVQHRLAELREERIEGFVTVQEYVARRVRPPMDFCVAVQGREHDLSRRLARAGQLLRTRVEVSLEVQNRALLSSMNRRAEMQLRLQETVELFSVVAILYYAAGVLSYLLGGLASLGVPVAEEKVLLIAIPAILALLLFAMARMRKRLKGSEPH